MKMPSLPVLLVSLAFAAGLAWADDQQGMNRKEADPQDMPGMQKECMEMMQSMKGMDSKDDMKDMPMDGKMSGKTHHAVGTVKSMDMARGTVTIAHGPVKSLKWGAMTMTFGVKDKMMLDKMAEGKKVEVDFVEAGSDYTIVKVR